MSAIRYLDNINLGQNELQNAVVQNLSTAPSSPKPGQVYYDSTGGVVSIKFWNGTIWVNINPASVTNIPLTAIAAIADGTLVGNNTGASASPTAISAAAVKTMLAITAGDVSGLTAAITAVRLDQMAAPNVSVAFNGQQITGLADPILAQDAATKNYVDGQVQGSASGIDPKDAVVAATTANITLSGLQTIDGVAVTAGQRVLVKANTAASTNGIYAAATGAWTRTPDAVQGKLTSGALVLSTGGTINAGTQWYLQTADPITVGTTNLTFTQFGAGGTYTADASGGLMLTGSAFAVKLPAGSGLIKDSTGLRVDSSLLPKKYAANIGDGASLAIVVTHNLGTQDVSITIRNASSPYEQVLTTNEATTTNTATIRFAVAPTTNQYRVTVIG